MLSFVLIHLVILHVLGVRIDVHEVVVYVAVPASDDRSSDHFSMARNDAAAS